MANLGDSGLRVIRRGQVAFATRTQEHQVGGITAGGDPDLDLDLGDSGLRVIRRGQVAFATRTQEHQVRGVTAGGEIRI